jgi:hypothetical protein
VVSLLKSGGIDVASWRICVGMDTLTLFGLFAVSAMLIFYAVEDRSPWFILAFAGACALGSAYGFLQGAWPFGLVEAIWAGVAVWRWRVRMANA